MRAGKLDRTIEVRRETFVSDGYGGQIPGGVATVSTLRAQVIQASTEEFIRTYGTSTETVVIFRTRWTDSVLLSDLLRYDGIDHNLIETKEIGRRRGLELRCKAVA